MSSGIEYSNHNQQEELTIVQLIDHPSRESVVDSTLLENYLKLKFGILNSKPFSLQFHKLYTLTHSQLKLYSCYDMVIYENLIILGGSGKLHLFNRFTKQFKKSIYTNIATHGMCIHQCYLYMTGIDGSDGQSKCFKFNLNILLLEMRLFNNGLIWKTDGGILQSGWGVSVLDDKVYIVDLSLIVFDSESGQRINDQPIMIPEMDAGSGFGITFTPEKEMILSRSSFFAHEPSSPLEMYKLNPKDGKWYLMKKAEPVMSIDRGSYGIFYEKSTQLIYQVDRKAKRVNIFTKELNRLEISFPLNSIYHYSIHLDERTGELYLPLMDSSAIVYN